MTGKAAVRFPSILLTHSFEVSIAALNIIAGLSVVLAEFSVELAPNDSLKPWLMIPVSLALVLGGIGMILGPQWRGTGFFGRALERAGLYLISTSWATVILAALTIAPSAALMLAIQGVVIIAGCAGRCVALSRVDRVVEHVHAVSELDKED